MLTTVKDFMTPSPLTIPAELSMHDAAERMFDNKIRHLPVTDGGHVVGIISDRDIAVVDTIPQVDRNKVLVGSAMSSNPYICSPETPLIDVVRTLCEHKIGTAIVMKDGKLSGIFTLIDALKALETRLSSEAASEANKVSN